MLRLVLQGEEYFDNKNQEFLTRNDVVLELEHSLAVLSKWESKWEFPFLGKQEKTTEQVMDYVRMMIQSPEPTPEIMDRLNDYHVNEIHKYIDSKQTATWFSDNKPAKPTGETITSELIYYWMFSAGIPIVCEDWHLNRLFTLIRVYGVKNAPDQKMNRTDLAAERRAENERRKQQYKTRG